MEENQLQNSQEISQENLTRIEEAKKFLHDFWGLIDKKELALDIALVIFIIWSLI